MRQNTKVCIKCKIRQPEENFNEHAPGKRRNVCKTCQRKHNVDWEAKNKERFDAGLVEFPLTKVCYACGIEQPRDCFTLDKSRKDGLYSSCKTCNHKKTKRIYKEYKDREDHRHYGWYIKKKYGITLSQKEELFISQGNRCAACGSVNVGRCINGKETEWPIDHDHKTNKVRGILCHPCNVALGNAEENPLRLRALADYIEKHTPKPAEKEN